MKTRKNLGTTQIGVARTEDEEQEIFALGKTLSEEK
jgi:hypothetical protein